MEWATQWAGDTTYGAHVCRDRVSGGQATAEETEGSAQGCLSVNFRASSSLEMLQFSDRLYFPKMATE